MTLNVPLADTVSIREKAIAMARCRTLGFLIGLLIVSADRLLADGYSETWPQWRGPRRDGSVSSDAWPDSLQSNHLVQLGLTNEGQLLLIHADPDRFVLVDSRTISTAETWGHLAIAGKQIYVRAKNDIAAYRWQ